MIVKIFDFNSAFNRDYFLLERFIVFKYFVGEYFYQINENRKMKLKKTNLNDFYLLEYRMIEKWKIQYYFFMTYF